MNIKVFAAIIIILLISSPLAAKEFSYKRQVVKKVEIEGNRYFSDSKLKGLMG